MKTLRHTSVGVMIFLLISMPFGGNFVFAQGRASTSSADVTTVLYGVIEAHNEAKKNDPVIVAVIDTGVDYTHPELAGRMWDGSECKSDKGKLIMGGCIHGYDFENNDNDPMGTDSHGTHIAGTIVSVASNKSEASGTEPQVEIMALRFGRDVASTVRAINFARENGAKVINASFDGPDPSSAEYRAIKAFQDAGGIFVASASNDGTDNDNAPHYPASYDLPAIISVAATDQYDRLAPFSNYGAGTVHVGAPGVQIKSLAVGSQYATLDGTSMAASYVSGLAALILSTDSSLTPAQVKDLIFNTGDHLPDLEGVTVTGKRVNVSNALAGLITQMEIARNEVINTAELLQYSYLEVLN